jgi:predicted signal transduction protein with EAL and GGDEF domain
MEAIRRNKPCVTRSSQIEAADVAADLAALKVFAHISVPIWVHQQRFGISVAFVTNRSELDLVAADITSLGDAVRPVLLLKVTEERMRFAAYHVDLTRLPNRLMFLGTAGNGNHYGKIQPADFRRPLPGFGWFQAGERHLWPWLRRQSLVAVARRLREVTGGNNIVARMGGDEFAVIQLIDKQPAEAVALAERLLAAISRPFELAGKSMTIGVSIGIALHPQHGGSPDLLLRNADQALYCAKKGGRNTCHVYDPRLCGRNPSHA